MGLRRENSFHKESEEAQNLDSDVILARHKYCPSCVKEIALAALKCPDCKKRWPGYERELELRGWYLLPILLPLLLAAILFGGASLGRTKNVEPYVATRVWEAAEYVEPGKLVIDYQPPEPVVVNIYVIFAGQGATDKVKSEGASNSRYVLNTHTHVFHNTSCGDINKMNEENKKTFTGNRSVVLGQGYRPCGNCNP